MEWKRGREEKRRRRWNKRKHEWLCVSLRVFCVVTAFLMLFVAITGTSIHKGRVFFLEEGSGVSQWCFQVLEKSAWCQKNVANICWINTVIPQNNNAWHSLRTFTALGPGLMFLLAECSVTCMSLQALFHPISQQCCNTFNEYILKIKRMNVRETNTVI